jgi:pentatricopeptide repeat protein
MKFTTRVALFAMGRPEESVLGTKVDTSTLPGLERHLIDAVRAAQEGRRDDCVASSHAALDSRFRDPEGRFMLMRNLCRVGEMDFALSLLRESVERGFLPRAMFDVDPWLAPLAEVHEVRELKRRMESAIAAARERFVQAGGPALLGVE